MVDRMELWDTRPKGLLMDNNRIDEMARKVERYITAIQVEMVQPTPNQATLKVSAERLTYFAGLLKEYIDE